MYNSTDGSFYTTSQDSNKQLYFVLMVVFASLLGLALLAALATPIIFKLCR